MKQFGNILKGVNYIARPTASAIIIDYDNRIVAVEYMNKYFLPGGGLENNETPEDALHRELTEELGWKIKIKNEICKAEEFLYAYVDKKYFNKQGVFYLVDKIGIISPPEKCEHEPLYLTFEEFRSKAAHESHIWACTHVVSKK